MSLPIDIAPCRNIKVPSDDVPFYHSIPLQVRFSDIDMLGHINNSVYLAMADLAKARYLAQVTGLSVRPGQIALAVVNINCDFFSPGYFDEPLAVVTRIDRISTHSVTMHQRIYNTSTGDVKAICRTVMAGFDPETANGIAIPDDITRQIEDFERRTLRIIS